VLPELRSAPDAGRSEASGGTRDAAAQLPLNEL